jgi:hypothetical protein
VNSWYSVTPMGHFCVFVAVGYPFALQSKRINAVDPWAETAS